jgi:hypothetical protein
MLHLRSRVKTFMRCKKPESAKCVCSRSTHGRLQLSRADNMRGEGRGGGGAGAHMIEHPSLQQARPALLQSMGVVNAQIVTSHERQIFRQCGAYIGCVHATIRWICLLGGNGHSATTA